MQMDAFDSILSDKKVAQVLAWLVGKKTATISDLVTGAQIDANEAEKALGQLISLGLVDRAEPFYFPTENGFRIDRELRSLRKRL